MVFQVVVFHSPKPSLFRAYPLARIPGSTSNRTLTDEVETSVADPNQPELGLGPAA